MYSFLESNIGYVLLEPRTRALIAVDVGDFEASHKVVTEIEKVQKAQLKYILTTHHHEDHVGGNVEWKKHRPNVKVVSGASELA